MTKHSFSIHQRATRIHTDYAVALPATPPRALVMALQGWAQSMDTFIPALEPLLAAPIMLVVPQAPYMFHKRLGSKETVFHWNTSYQRDRSIADNNRYLKDVWKAVARPELPVFLLGYSQGASVAYRCAAANTLPLAGLIACCADFPEDCAESLSQTESLPLLLVQGTKDVLFPPASQQQIQTRLKELSIPFDTQNYEGNHRLKQVAMPPVATWILAHCDD